MDEEIRNRIILALVVLAIALFVGNISSCVNAKQYKDSRCEEMAKRLDAEEKLSKFTQEKNEILNKLNAAEKVLEEEKASHQAIKKALVQEQLISQSVKEELQKVTKLKEALEEDLKDALVADKTKHKK